MSSFLSQQDHTNETSAEHEQFMNQPYLQTFHLGIIDFLQDWSLQKRAERFIKTFNKDPSYKKRISAIPPKEYQTRFMDFMKLNVLKTKKRRPLAKKRFLLKLQGDL